MEHEGISEHFSASYSQAQERFLQAAVAARAQITSYDHPHLKDANGKPLSVHVATLGEADSPRALVLISGTHGIEGYCGSAIQTAYLRSAIRNQLSGVKTVLVHALNPFGFCHLRRVNEDNVDLNRNFIDFNKLPPSNDSYAKLADLLQRRPTLLTRATLIAHILLFGLRTMQDAVTRGQYYYPKGLFFGGLAEAWSQLTWSTILSEHLYTAQNALFIDYHTGLGRYGVGEILCPSEPESRPGQVVSMIFGDEVRFLQRAVDKVRDRERGDKLQGGWTPVATPPTGDILSFTMSSRGDGSFAGIFLEFGTLPPLAVLEALMAENADYQTFGNGRDIARSKQRLRNAFCPNDPKWQSGVCDRALAVTSRAAGALVSKMDG